MTSTHTVSPREPRHDRHRPSPSPREPHDRAQRDGLLSVGLPGSKYLEAAARQSEPTEPLQHNVFRLVEMLDGAFIIATGTRL